MPKGKVTAKVAERLELLHIYRTRVAPKLLELVESQMQAAQGVSHLMAKDRDGKFIQVTDPVMMARVLNSGETFYRIHAQNPDVRALKDIFDRLMGMPTQALELTGAEGQPLEVKWLS